jgi:hypothetical protein
MTKLFVFACVSLLAIACTTTVVNAEDEHPSEADAYRLYVGPTICSKSNACNPDGFAKDYPTNGETECEAQLFMFFGTRTQTSACTVRQLKQCRNETAAAECSINPITKKPTSTISDACQGC